LSRYRFLENKIMINRERIKKFKARIKRLQRFFPNLKHPDEARCSCWMCRSRKTREDRNKAKAEWKKTEVNE